MLKDNIKNHSMLSSAILSSLEKLRINYIQISSLLELEVN